MTISFILYCSFMGLFAGLVAGMLGVGGGVIIVPLLVALFIHYDVETEYLMQLATGSSLAIIFGTSLNTIRAHRKRIKFTNGHIWPLAGGGILGAIIGRWLGLYLHEYVVAILFDILLLSMAINLIKPQRVYHTEQRIGPKGLCITGIIAGALGALLGLGGGILVVPVLYHFGMKLNHAIALSAASTCMIALTGTLQAIWTGWNLIEVEHTLGFVFWPACLAVLVTSLSTAPLGVRWAHELPADRLKPIFAIFLTIIALNMTYQVFAN